MDSSIAVATTVSGRFNHVSLIESARTEVFIAQRCASLAELIATARSGRVDVIVIADDTEHVGASFPESLVTSRTGESGGAPVVSPVGIVVLTDLPTERQRLQAFGMTVLAPTASAEEMIDGIRRAAANRFASPPEPRPSASPVTTQSPSATTPDFDAELAAFLDAEQPEEHPVTGDSEVTDDELTDETERHDTDHPVAGRITAVWGPTGAPGRSTLAVNLAAESALLGHRTLLIDADTYAASVAIMLGLLDDSAGIAQACRAAEHQNLSAQHLGTLCQQITLGGPHPLHVLTGLTRADRWPELRPSSVNTVLEVASTGYDHIIVDTGFGIEQDEELSFDIPAPQRNATTLTALDKADTVLVVGTGDPVGLPRLMKAVDAVTPLTATHATITPIVNKLSRVSSGLNPENQVRDVWQRFGPRQQVQFFLPAAHDKCATALMNGQVLAETAPKHDVRTGIQAIAASLLPAVEETPKSTRRRTKTRIRPVQPDPPRAPEHQPAAPALSRRERREQEKTASRRRRR